MFTELDFTSIVLILHFISKVLVLFCLLKWTFLCLVAFGDIIWKPGKRNLDILTIHHTLKYFELNLNLMFLDCGSRKVVISSEGVGRWVHCTSACRERLTENLRRPLGLLSCHVPTSLKQCSELIMCIFLHTGWLVISAHKGRWKTSRLAQVFSQLCHLPRSRQLILKCHTPSFYAPCWVWLVWWEPLETR